MSFFCCKARQGLLVPPAEHWHYTEVRPTEIYSTTEVKKAKSDPRFRRDGPWIRQGAINNDQDAESDHSEIFGNGP